MDKERSVGSVPTGTVKTLARSQIISKARQIDFNSIE
jgi:hypothetical protein